MIAACGAPVSHSDRAAVYARRGPISTPGHIREGAAHPEDNQYIYDAGPGSSWPTCEARLKREVPGHVEHLGLTHTGEPANHDRNEKEALTMWNTWG